MLLGSLCGLEREQGAATLVGNSVNGFGADCALNVFDKISSRNLFSNLRFKLNGGVVHSCHGPLFQGI